jgi:hypothetical protein
MKKWIRQNTIIARMAVCLAHCFFNPTPDSLFQHAIKLILKYFSSFRKTIIHYANSVSEFDLYHSQAMAILERAGIHSPNQFQINNIEQLLKTK